jgi:mxaJ protein
LVLGSAGVEARELRVCGDPNNLPFSNRKLQGFENKIAAMLAKDLHRKVNYTWMPQRRNFFRRTLLAKACDVVMGVPANFEMVATTKPYYRSTYAFVSARAKKLRIASFDDPTLRQLKIGLHAVGAEGANTPPAHALAKRGIVHNVVGFRMWEEGSVANPPSKIIDAVAHGDIDLAIVWGPFAGYFAQQHQGQLDVSPVLQDNRINVPFSYDISLGVRKDDAEFKRELESVLERRRGDILIVLKQYHIPLVETGHLVTAEQ